MPDTREQIIERMARAIALKRGRGFAEQEDRILATAALAVVGRSITGRVRDAIDEVLFDLSFDDRTEVVAVADILPVLDQIDAELEGE